MYERPVKDIIQTIIDNLNNIPDNITTCRGCYYHYFKFKDCNTCYLCQNENGTYARWLNVKCIFCEYVECDMNFPEAMKKFPCSILLCSECYHEFKLKKEYEIYKNDDLTLPDNETDDDTLELDDMDDMEEVIIPITKKKSINIPTKNTYPNCAICKWACQWLKKRNVVCSAQGYNFCKNVYASDYCFKFYSSR